MNKIERDFLVVLIDRLQSGHVAWNHVKKLNIDYCMRDLLETQSADEGKALDLTMDLILESYHKDYRDLIERLSDLKNLISKSEKVD